MKCILVLIFFFLSWAAKAGQSGDWTEVGRTIDSWVEGGVYDQIQASYVDGENASVVLNFPVPQETLSHSFPATPIHALPGSSLSFTKRNDDQTQFRLVLPLKYVVREMNLPIYERLPSGDPLPFMPARDIKGFSIALPDGHGIRVHFYFALNSFAAFIEIPEIAEIPFAPIYMGFPAYNRSKARVGGFLGLFGRKGNNSAGTFLAIRIPDDIATIVDRLIGVD